MTMNGMVTSGNINISLVPEWARAERYEYCEDFYESYTTGTGSKILTKIASRFIPLRLMRQPLLILPFFI